VAQVMLKNCLVCRKPAVEKFQPFCCKRCADIDLGRWLGEKYRLETDEKVQSSDQIPDSDEE
jgi:uncharacterized protein